MPVTGFCAILCQKCRIHCSDHSLDHPAVAAPLLLVSSTIQKYVEDQTGSNQDRKNYG